MSPVRRATRSLLALLVSAILAVMLAACAKDPVLADLTALDNLGRAVFETQAAEMSEFNRKVAAAKSNAEKAALLNTMVAGLELRTKELATFKAATPEVKKIADLLVGGLTQSIEGAREASQAFEKGDQARLSKASEKMQAGQKSIREGQQAFGSLVKEKGYKRS